MTNNIVPVKLAMLCAFVITPALLLAQRGMARGFAGGFHAGGGVGHFHHGHYGAGSYGGHGFYAWHPGYHGRWYGTGWSYPYYGFGFGVSIGFGWTPYSYWAPYPSVYGYGPWLVPRYYSPSDGICDYRHPTSTNQGQDCQNSRHVPRTIAPASPNVTRAPDRNRSLDPGGEDPDTYDPDQSNQIRLTSNNPPLRREMKNALATLRAMPPGARQRWINSGHYKNLSAEERALLKRVSEDKAENTLQGTLATVR